MGAYYLGPAPRSPSGPAYINGQVILTYTHGMPPVTEFSFNPRWQWRGPQCQLFIEPDGKTGEFDILDVHGRHIKEGLFMKGEQFQATVETSALIKMTIERSRIREIKIVLY